MGRRLRLLVDNGFYHILGRGNNKMPVFEISNGYQMFKYYIYQAKKKYNWKLFHYCLMPNHYHLLIQIQKGEDLPKVMKSILLNYSIWYRKKVDYTGYLWQGRYKNPMINTESYLLECGRYIERNPVRASLVNDPKDYPWSSYGYYAHGRVDDLIDTDPCFENFGLTGIGRQEHYREFVSLDGPYEKIVDAVFAIEIT